MWMTKMLLKKGWQKMLKICNLSCQAEEVMTKRNEELKKENKIPYTVLLPSRIPAGISIWSDAFRAMADEQMMEISFPFCLLFI